MRDSQRAKVYRWENFIPTEILTLEECRRLVTASCRKFNVHVPLIKDGRGCRSAQGGRYKIILPVWARNKRDVLHEVSHTIASFYFHRPAGHGLEFVRIFIELLVAFKVETKSELISKARRSGVKFASAVKCKRRRGQIFAGLKWKIDG